MGSRVCSVDGLLAVDLDDAAILDVSHVLQLVEDVACLVLDEDGCVGRFEHAHGEFLGKHVGNERVQSIQAAQLVGDMHPPRLIPELQEEDT